MNDAKSTALVAGGMARGIIPQTFEDAYRLARVFAATKLVPKDYQDKPEDCCVAIMQGLELGLSPIAAVQSISVINGRPCLWGDGMMAVVRASGLLESIEETDDGATATCTVHRKGEPKKVVRTFSQEDAKRAGLAGKAGPWTQYPHRMRQMRARSWALRDTFADVLKGISSAEEMSDVAPMKDITPIAASIPDIPDIPDGTEATTCDAEADQRYSDQDFLKSLEDCMAAASSIETLKEVMESNADEIAERGLQQAAAYVYDRQWRRLGPKEPVEEPAAEAPAEAAETPAEPSLPWDAEEDNEPDTEEDLGKFSDDAARVALEGFERALAMCPNATRVKDLRRQWNGNIEAFDKPTQARFDALVAQAMARVKLAQKAYA